MSRKINLNILKRKSTIKEVDLHDGEAPIKVETTPSEEVKEKIIESLIKNSKSNDGDKVEIDITNKMTFLLATQLITDIELQRNEKKMFIDYLFNDPSKYGIILKNTILKVINNIVEEFCADQILDYDEVKN
ncbi:hypothetical protein ACFHWD_04095 [Clostridium sp. MT-14]|uniref:hypothetical protein n=1 Tax=Clostridium sp. MT-14 TaxID=3348360 RepID=UPI0035F453D7